MLQDIKPNKMNIDFKHKSLEKNDCVLIIEDNELLVKKKDNGQLVFATFSQVDFDEEELIYLFAVDETNYYLYRGKFKSDVSYVSVAKRELLYGYENIYTYIGLTACHIADWYESHRYCGKCGQKNEVGVEERKMTCVVCQHIVYPRISPVVIVAIENKGKLLLTKYANSDYNRYALVAGFVEVGESLEATVHREVFEEVGVRVKNLSYYDSQPWGISGGLLAGFFADLDGDDTIVLDLDELKEGRWMSVDEMPALLENEKTLTRTMMYEWSKRQREK